MLISFVKEKLNLLLSLANLNIYIVGGFVRENILGNFSKDIDFIVEEDIEILLKDFLKLSKGTLVVLDKERKMFRITWKSMGIDFDFSPIKNTLKYDLLNRDLTINSISIKLDIDLINIIDKKFPIELLIDYSNGYSDIENKIVRTNSIEILEDDPLRLLRIFRFSAKYNFSIEKETLNYISKLSHLIKIVSKERVLKEITTIFSFKYTYKYINLMLDNNLYKNLFYFNKDTINNIIQTLKNIEEINFDIENIYLLKLSILFIFNKDFNSKELENFLRDFKLSSKELNFILKQKKYFDLLDIENIDISNKVFLFYFFRERKDILKEALIIYISIFYGTKYYENFKNIFDIYLNNKELYEHKKIIDGNIIKNRFPNIQSNKIGFILEQVNLYQATKEISNLKDALNKIEYIITHQEGFEPPTN